MLAGRLPDTPRLPLSQSQEPLPPSLDATVSLQQVLLHLSAPAAPTSAAAAAKAADAPLNFSSLDVAACEATIWEDWRACVQHLLESASYSASSFDDFIISEAQRLPWSLGSHYTAVLVEFRAWPRQLHFAVRNALENLPAHWRIQIVGGPAICRLVEEQLFPVEVAAAKVVCSDLGLGDYMRQDLISRVLTDDDLLYSKLLGDTWLFFQVWFVTTYN